MKLKKLLLIGATLLACSWAQALTLAPYSAEALSKAQAAGNAVALHFHADWCPTCHAQDKALQSLKSEPNLDVLVLTVDYDKETELKKQLKVRSQSTLIVYRGAVEKARKSGESSTESIRATLRTAL